MKVSVWVTPVASAVILFGSVGVAGLTGDWVTGGRAVPVTSVGTGTGRPADGPGSTVAITGQMTLAQVARASGVDLAELVKAVGLPPDVDTGVPLRELKQSIPSFEVQQVRDAVARLS